MAIVLSGWLGALREPKRPAGEKECFDFAERSFKTGWGPLGEKTFKKGGFPGGENTVTVTPKFQKWDPNPIVVSDLWVRFFINPAPA
jgi:hypothetical protein